ncbi:MAG: hypothetical protein ACM3KH_00280, partial [Thiobacillus sp.]
RSARSLEVVTTRIDEPKNAKNVATPAQEKWLVSAISSRFDELKNTNDAVKILDELYVLIGSLKVLGLDGAHVAMKTRLVEYMKNTKGNKT